MLKKNRTTTPLIIDWLCLLSNYKNRQQLPNKGNFIIFGRQSKLSMKKNRKHSKNRNAIRILQINDYPVATIDEAMHIAKQLDTINEHTGTI